MALQLMVGQTFAADFTLLKHIGTTPSTEIWLALNTTTSQKVTLSIFNTVLDAHTQHKLTTNIAKQSSLLHRHIARVYQLNSTANHDFILSQYVKGGTPIDPNLPFNQQWQYLKPAMGALEYAHSLGFAHGLLYPEHLLVDSHQKVTITHFGINTLSLSDHRDAHPENINHEGQAAYISPEITRGHTPTPADDIFSIGQYIHFALSGKLSRQGQGLEPRQPISDALQELILSMVQLAPDQRPGNFKTIREAIDAATTNTLSLDIPAANFHSAAKQSGTASSTRRRYTLPQERHGTSAVWAVLLALLILLGGSLLFYYLPKQTALDSLEPDPFPAIAGNSAQSNLVKSSHDGQSEDTGPILAPLELAKLEQLKTDNTALAKQLLYLQIQLEDKGGLIWAKEDYAQSTKLGIAGDQAYREAEYQLAFNQYTKAIAVVETLLTSVDEVFARHQTEGEAALERGDAKHAIHSFNIVLAIEPSNATLKAKLTRANNLATVLTLIQDAEAIERDQNLDLALEKFKAAYTIDPDWPAAAEAMTRVKDKIATVAFNDHMSAAFVSFANKQYSKARRAFEAAQSIRPTSLEPQDGLEQVDIAEQQAQVNTHQLAAKQFMQAGQYEQAIAELNTILSLVPGSVATKQSLHYAETRLQIYEQLNDYITKPQLMLADQELAAAKTVLLAAAKIKQPDRILDDQKQQLSHLISLARIKVNIELRSDNLTHVEVYRVGKFGRLKSTQLSLYPGAYTFVGKRQGYRDVYQQSTIYGGKPQVAITISCTERI